MHTPDDELAGADKKLEAYLKQFDNIKRCNEEYQKRWKAITEERKKALTKSDPLPIKPMSIELDLCYKDKPKV